MVLKKHCDQPHQAEPSYSEKNNPRPLQHNSEKKTLEKSRGSPNKRDKKKGEKDSSYAN